jgi:hypothetical protein
MQQGQYSLALGDCRAAYGRNLQATNGLALAEVLSVESAFRDRERARSLVTASLPEVSSDFIPTLNACRVALNIADTALLGNCSTRLRELDDTSWEAQVFTSWHHALPRPRRRPHRRPPLY